MNKTKYAHITSSQTVCCVDIFFEIILNKLKLYKQMYFN